MGSAPTIHDVVVLGAEAGSKGSTPPRQAQLGQYVLLERLGAGGMGIVFKAMHSKLKRIVALKVLLTERLVQSGMIERFYQEMEAIGRLDHPNLIRATDAGEDDGRLYLVMDFVEGKDLLKVVNAWKALPVAQASAVIRQAALGLQYVHEQGMVHRDIKPSNLMLTSSGQVKILDMGLALLKDREPAGGRELTAPGQVVGTWDFMAPEQTRNSHRVDIRADIYSLGCTFYKLLTGRAPFESQPFDSYHAKALAHQEVAAEPVTKLRTELPHAVQAVLDKMLAKNPAERYQQPAEVAQVLTAFVGSAPLADLVPRVQDQAPDGMTDPLVVPGVADTGVKSPSTGIGGSALPTRLYSTRGKRWVLALALMALTLGGTAAGAAILLRHYSGEENKEPADEPRVGQWYPLMRRPPKELLWTKNIAPPVWRKEQDEILADSGDHPGFLGLGEASLKQPYRFQVMIRQNQWVGHVGVFFGFRKEIVPGETLIHCQNLKLTQDKTNPAAYCWIRRQMVMRLTEDGMNPISGTQAAVQQVARPRDGEHMLEIHVRSNALLRVMWDGFDCKELCTLSANAPLGEEDYAGAFGVFVMNSQAVFRDGRVLYLER